MTSLQDVGGAGLSAPSGGQRRLGAQRVRHQLIAETIIKRGSMGVEALAEAAGVSVMTVYRDVAALEEAGIVQRQRGQVLAVASSLQEASASFRLDQNSGVKAAMAQALAPLVPAGSSVMIDDSTSGIWLLRALDETSPLTVVTNSLLAAQELERRDDVRLFVVGGEYQPWAQSMMGPGAVRTIASMHADFCVMSCSGLVDGLCMHPYPDVAEVKRAMLASSSTKVLMLDHSKWERRALHGFARLADFDVVVVDEATTAERRELLDGLGVEVVVADG